MATTTVDKRKKMRTALADAIAHPWRSRCLTILADRVASPVEIARELNVEVSSIGYHVKTLHEAGLIEEVSNRSVRGAVEHFYRAVVRPRISAAEEAELSPAERNVFAETTLSIFAANVSSALTVGTLTQRPDHYLARLPMRVDEKGWDALNEAYAEMFERVYAIQEESAERLGPKQDDPGIPTISFLTFFEMPGEKKASRVMDR